MAITKADVLTNSNERLLKLEEVAILIDSSGKSINNWYMFKKANPDNEYAKMLPEFVQEGPRQTRYWKESDIWKLLEFKKSIPQGRNGVMGCITQKYYRKEENNEQTEATDSRGE